MVEPEQQDHSQYEEKDKLQQISHCNFKVGQLGFQTNGEVIDKAVTLGTYKLNLKCKLIYSQFTKNPLRIINLKFDKILSITQNQLELLKQDNSGQDNDKTYKTILSDKQYSYKINEKDNEKLLYKDDSAINDQSGQNSSGVRTMTQSGQYISSSKFQLLFEFDNCLENQGFFNDVRAIGINQYGSQAKLEDQQLQIKNVKFNNAITVNLCTKAANCKNKETQNVIAHSKFYIAEVPTQINQPFNLLLPLQLCNEKTQLKDLYMLAQITVTNQTFGELCIDLNSFDCIPKTLKLQNLQWKVSVSRLGVDEQEIKEKDFNKKKEEFKNSKILEKQKQTQTQNQIQEIEVYQYQSTRINYDINLSKLQIDRQIRVPYQMKDIITDRQQFLRETTKQVYYDQDLTIKIELLGFNPSNNLMILGSQQFSLIEMVQQQYVYEQQSQSLQKEQQTKSQISSSMNEQDLQSRAEQSLNELQGVSKRFQKMFKQQYVTFNNTKCEKLKQDLQANQKQQLDNDTKLNNDVPEGYQQIEFERPPYQEGIDHTRIQLPLEIENQSKPQCILRIKWEQSYKNSNQTEDFHEIKEEIRQYERIKERKKISNILQTLNKAKQISAIVTQNLTTLSIVLASESCYTFNSEEEIQDHELLKNVQNIVEVLALLYKEYRKELDHATFINIMKCITYLKILTECSTKHTQLFNESILNSFLIDAMLEEYQGQGLNKSKIFSIEFFKFISTLVIDIPQLYFNHISGVRLDTMLQFINLNNKDYQIVDQYSRFLNAIGECLFKQDTNNKEGVEVVKRDMILVAKSVNSQLHNLVDGLKVYKNDYEVLCSRYCQTALQFLHLSIFKAEVIKNDKEFVLPDIIQNLYMILVDGVVSMLALDFVSEIKKRLIYEISLIKSLDLKEELRLMFNDGLLHSLLKTMTEHFKEVITNTDQHKKAYALRFFENTKLIFEFFCSDFSMNAFGENNYKLIREILRDKSIEDNDFVLLLHKIVKLDVEMESSIEGETKEERIARTMNERYGQFTIVNKFSLSRIEWLEQIKKDKENNALNEMSNLILKVNEIHKREYNKNHEQLENTQQLQEQLQTYLKSVNQQYEELNQYNNQENLNNQQSLNQLSNNIKECNNLLDSCSDNVLDKIREIKQNQQLSIKEQEQQIVLLTKQLKDTKSELQFYKDIFDIKIEEVTNSNGEEFSILMNGKALIDRMKVKQLSTEKIEGEKIFKVLEQVPSQKLAQYREQFVNRLQNQ